MILFVPCSCKYFFEDKGYILSVSNEPENSCFPAHLELLHQYFLAINYVKPLLKVSNICVASDQSAVRTIYITLSVRRPVGTYVSDSRFSSFDKEEVFPLLCLLIFGKAFHGNLQCTIPLIDVVQCLCATSRRSGRATDDLGQI